MTLYDTTTTLNGSRQGESFATRAAILTYGIACYAIGVGSLVWLILTLLGFLPFWEGPVRLASTRGAILFNLSFIVLFGVQHAVMARPAFKKHWTRIIPASMERSTFVLTTGVIVSSFLFFWHPLEAVVWSVSSPAVAHTMTGIAILGWAYMLTASFAINHFELFGLKQVWQQWTGRESTPSPVVTRFMYRFDRHPLMTGMLIGFWCTPVMQLDRLVLTAGLTVYMVIGVAIEERTLVAVHGESYRSYRRQVGALVPLPGRRR